MFKPAALTAAVLLVVARAPAEPPSAPEPPSEEQIAAWVDDLRDDDIRGNADTAMDELSRAGEAAVPFLENALASADRQQRQLALYVLTNRRAYEPSDAALHALVEALADDEFPRNPSRGYEKGYSYTYTYCFNAARATPILIRYADRAERYLILALTSDDEQQRFLAAYILGAAGRTIATPLIADILIPHLRDNDIEKDASLACYALYHLGEPARPLIRAAAADADEQQLELINLILDDLDDPPSTQQELVERGHRQHVTHLVYDPAINYLFREFHGFR